jgi:hypothetical protein
MKRFLINSILFLAVFFVVEKSSYYLLYKAPQKEIDKRLQSVLNGEMNKELIVLGSSRGVGNILTGQLQQETGLSSFNLSYQGSNIEFHDFVFSTVLKYNHPPKKLILCLDSPYAFFKAKALDFPLSSLRPFAKYNYINNELIHRGENSVLSKLFYLGRINKTNFSFKKKQQRLSNPLNQYGSMPLVKMSKRNETLLFDNNLIDYDTVVESSSKLEAFKHIQRLCKENNIELICVFPPNFRVFNYGFLKRFKLLLTAENSFFVYNLEQDSYKNSYYFYDNAHLNIEGAKIFTTELSTFINLYTK